MLTGDAAFASIFNELGQPGAAAPGGEKNNVANRWLGDEMYLFPKSWFVRNVVEKCT